MSVYCVHLFNCLVEGAHHTDDELYCRSVYDSLWELCSTVPPGQGPYVTVRLLSRFFDRLTLVSLLAGHFHDRLHRFEDFDDAIFDKVGEGDLVVKVTFPLDHCSLNFPTLGRRTLVLDL